MVGALVLAGVAIRTWIALTNYGVGYDTDTASIVARLLSTHPLHAYSSIRYPYPAGYLPVLLVCHWFSDLVGAPFWAVWKLPSIAGDAGLILALVWGVGRLGGSPRLRLACAALVALGPIFVIVSGYHGQLDPVAILPALLAVVIWQLEGPGRGWQAGLLIGLGAAIKTVPFFMVLALLPTARSRREAAMTVTCALAVPLLSILPFLAADPHDTWRSLTFNTASRAWAASASWCSPRSCTGGWWVRCLTSAPPRGSSSESRTCSSEQRCWRPVHSPPAGAWRPPTRRC